jgi:hypothetical protein
MAIRVARRRPLFSADMNHLHHNLMACGLRQGESVVTIYVLQMFLVVSAFLFRFHSDWLLLGLSRFLRNDSLHHGRERRGEGRRITDYFVLVSCEN